MWLWRWLDVRQSRYGRFMRMGYRWPHRTGVATAATALVLAAGAAVISGLALVRPVEPAQHTVNVIAPLPATYNTSDIEAAKATACTAWDQAARTITAVGKQRASTAQTTGRSSVETDQARTVEKRTTAAQISYLRTQLTAVTPDDVRTPISDWMAAQIDAMHGVNIRNWDASNAAITRGNNLVDVIDARCGLS
jgi:hypothetical protein